MAVILRLCTLAVLCLCMLLQPVRALNVLIGNDDSFGTANIRALYNHVRAAGHEAIIAAPAMQQSGTDGLRRRPTKLYADGAFGLVPKGAPAEGADPHDDHIYYINSTPASSIEFGLRDLCPRLFRGAVDIVITGTNQGNNLGLSYLGSGTYGAAKFAVTSDNIPAIAFSAGNATERAFTTLDGDSQDDQANVYARMAVTLLQHLIDNREKGNGDRGDGARLLPSGTLLNVNFPSQPKYACQADSSRWVLTRILGTLDRSPDTCTCRRSESEACKLPTEASIIRNQSPPPHACTNTVSVSVPHLRPDASAAQQLAVAEKLQGLLSCP